MMSFKIFNKFSLKKDEKNDIVTNQDNQSPRLFKGGCETLWVEHNGTFEGKSAASSTP